VIAPAKVVNRWRIVRARHGSRNSITAINSQDCGVNAPGHSRPTEYQKRRKRSQGSQGRLRLANVIVSEMTWAPCTRYMASKDDNKPNVGKHEVSQVCTSELKNVHGNCKVRRLSAKISVRGDIRTSPSRLDVSSRCQDK